MKELTAKYSGKNGYKIIAITQNMFKVIMEFNINDPELSDILNTTREVKTINCDKNISSENFYELITDKILALNNYETLKFDKIPEEKLMFFILKQNNIIKELIMVTGDSFNESIFSIKGNINLLNIYRISELIDLKELKNLERVAENEDN